MDTHNDSTPTTSPEVEARRKAATAALVDKQHAYYHKYNGADAPCERCAREKAAR